ncbi:Organic solute transporter alpha-like protein [Pseudolycoriella hygida]|uniref:Organic solute transporter alpha-like protein n=1 Tax=Pseudolycoriella hygida TaxID=35572 RepID=A0A9Q0MQD7_9DIPT|nr:Organic solute transporter alpha-like protein [Pseudolycoriella hygida]
MHMAHSFENEEKIGFDEDCEINQEESDRDFMNKSYRQNRIQPCTYSAMERVTCSVRSLISSSKFTNQSSEDETHRRERNMIDSNISKYLGNITNELRSPSPLPRTAELFAVHNDDVISIRQIEETILRGDPTASEIFRDLSTFLLVSYIVGLILFLITLIKFILFIPNILRNTPARYVSRTFLLCGMYTIVAASSLTSILVPRALIFCESVSIVTFGLCSYQFFCLCVDYAGGECNFIQIADDVKVLNMRTPPCCCCLCFMHPMHINKNTFLKLRILILQLPIVLGILYFMLNVIYLEDSVLFNDINFYFMPFMGISILIGIWGLQITSRMFSPLFLEYKIMPKYLSMQLVLLICKLQPLVAQIEVAVNGSSSDEYPITRKVFGNVIVQLLILFEVICLSFWCHHLYKGPSRNGAKEKEETEST